MLDIETRRRIDSARDILVGKVPDPKAQVEQITTALVYKFMDDMDKESVELGGKAQFFSNGYNQYAWSKLMDTRLGGHERLALYGEAITKLSENPNIPQLFRNIFKDAFLPYRDPETLNLFLKEINGFIYDHSERLGDAYEYLLSVLGSQGDAGQFRTPRHIIDFIVKVVDPDKTETILDPACGTAGFLISAFKHILGKYQKNKPGDLMTPAERKKFMGNFAGYDISPDMVRIALVNMYLHGFPNPNIPEYDTLTSEEKWDELYDVILANPPFMSPKGGIRPHKRFAIQTTRSEALFVDYIMEHLTITGRAGIIVPEGIIFQAQTSHTAVRKKLVDEHLLYAVISLPAGIFNPYSGVKTSILLLDKSIAKTSDSILFIKIQNDGFELGAQRREMDGSELHQALELIKYHKQNGTLPPISHIQADIVKKTLIADSQSYNLTGDRYKANIQIKKTSFEMIPIGQACELINGRAFKPEDWKKEDSGGLPIIRIQNLNNHDSDFNYYKGTYDDKHLVIDGDLLFSWSGSKGTSFGAHYWHGKKAILNQHIFRVVPSNLVSKDYLYWALNKSVEEVEENLHGGVGLVHITKGNLEKIEIPLPPLEIQQQIVAELSQYQKVIDGARMVVENYRPEIHIEETWPKLKVKDISTLVRGSSPRPQGDKRYFGGKVPRLMVADLTRDGMYVTPQIDFLTEEGAKKSRPMKKGEVVMAVSGNPGLPAILSMDACIHDGFVGFRELSPKVIPEYFYSVLLNFKDMHDSQSVGAVFKNLNTAQINEFDIPVPTLNEQKKIIEQVKNERTAIAHTSRICEMMQSHISRKLSEIWGE